MFKRDWRTCSTYVNHSKLTSQHDCGDLYIYIYDRSTSTKMFTFCNGQDIHHMNSNNHQTNGYIHDFSLLRISRELCVSCPACAEKSFHSRHIYYLSCQVLRKYDSKCKHMTDLCRWSATWVG